MNKEKKIIAPTVPNERGLNYSTPERITDEETKKFEETSKKLQELKQLIPENK